MLTTPKPPTIRSGQWAMRIFYKNQAMSVLAQYDIHQRRHVGDGN